MTGYTEEDLGFAEICAVLSERFGTRFALQNAGGNCVTLMAHLEGGIKVLITDCVGTLSPIQWHLDGHAAGFFVGVYHREPGTPMESRSTSQIDSLTPAARPLRRPPRQSATWCRRRWKVRGSSAAMAAKVDFHRQR